MIEWVIVGCRVRARGIYALPHEIRLIDDVASQMIACEPNEQQLTELLR
jgi:hypothetical protein